jgi:hypothetical protein
MDAVPSGSYLVIAHAASDILSAEVRPGFETYNDRSPVRLIPRSREQMNRLAAGLDPVRGGVLPMSQWFEPGHIDGAAADLTGYCCLHRKP